MFVLGLGCLYLVAYMILRRPLLAILPVVPLVLSPTFPVDIVPRVGPDAVLMAALCLFLLAWVALDRRGQGRTWTAAIVMGVLGGVCAWTKINGALVLVAYAAYMAIGKPSLRKYSRGAVALAVGAVTFYLLNPAFIGQNPAAVFVDILVRRAQVIQVMRLRFGPLGWTAVLSEAVRCWAFLPVLAWVAWKVRNVPLMVPVLLWGGVLAVGNLAVMNLPLPRYLGPVELGLHFGGALAVLALAIVLRNKIVFAGPNGTERVGVALLCSKELKEAKDDNDSQFFAG